MKAGEVRMIYGNPIKLEYPLGKAQLVSQMTCHNEKLEYWNVNFLDEENITRPVLIKKENGEDKKQ